MRIIFFTIVSLVTLGAASQEQAQTQSHAIESKPSFCQIINTQSGAKTSICRCKTVPKAASCKTGTMRPLAETQCTLAEDLTCFAVQEECDETGAWVKNFDCVGADEEVKPAWQSQIGFCLQQEGDQMQVAMQVKK